jgi:hypothetical protein
VLFNRAPKFVVYGEGVLAFSLFFPSCDQNCALTLVSYAPSVTYTTKSFMRDVTPIDLNWLPELAPHFYEKKGPQFAVH